MKRRLLSLALILSLLCARGGSSMMAVEGTRFSDVAPNAWFAVVLQRWLTTSAPTRPEPPQVAPVTPAPEPTQPPKQEEELTMPTLTIQAGGRTFAATLEDSETTRALVAQLPITVSMGELNGNEKYYYLPSPLPTNSQRPGALRNGDLMLYGENCLVLFYESFSSGYSYTRLGSVDDPTGLATALGSGSIEVTFLTGATEAKVK